MLKLMNKGFTLVEIIVTVVILAVLMAIVSPIAFNYLSQGDDAQALSQAYACVSAGDYYGIRASLHDVDPSERVTPEIIQKKADVNGTIEDFTYDIEDNSIEGLLYKSEKGIYVTYTGTEYVIGDEAIWSISRYYSQLKNLENSSDLIKESLASPELSIRKKATKEIQSLYKEKYKTSYPKLTKKEIQLIESHGRYQPNYPITNLVWKPSYATDGTLVLLADLTPNDTKSSCVMVYYKGHYYVHVFKYSSTASPQITPVSILESSLPIKDGHPYDPNRPSENVWTLAQ